MVLPGGLLVLLTWAATVSLVVLLGLPFTMPFRGAVTLRHLAAASWWGVLVTAVLGTVLAFFVPLSSPGTRTTILIAGLFAVGITVFRWKRRRLRRVRITMPTWLWIAGAAIAMGYLAIATLGPVTHYDAGLYQWAAGRYAAEYPVMPGLANLYAPLGYGSIQPVFEGLMASSPWRVNGLRLVNGSFLVLLVLETLSRLATKPRAAGTAVALVGSTITFVPMLWMADFWVASPTPDVPVLVLGIAGAAYWTDFVLEQPKVKRKSLDPLPVLIVLGGLLVALRPTMAPLVVFLGAATLALLVMKRRTATPIPVLVALALVALQGILLAARDRMLSGWLQFPLSIYSFDVPWRASDPTGLRRATLGYARDPDNWQEAVSGWSWLGPWISRLPNLWDPWLFLAAVIAGAALLTLAKLRGTRIRIRALAVACAPFVLAASVWLAFLPPAFRFGWASLFGLAAIVAGWGVWMMRWSNVMTGLAGLALGGVALTSFFVRFDSTTLTERGSWLGVNYRYASLPSPPVKDVSLTSGLELLVPIESDQCWSVYPLCTPRPDPSLRSVDGQWQLGLTR